MKVELIDSAGGDISIVNSARVSFAKEVEEIGEGDERLIRYLATHKHITPFRHNFIQLRCSVPLFLARQLMKHQAGLTWNEVSRRYVDDVPDFHVPEEWRARPEGGIKQGSGGVVEVNSNLKLAYNDYIAKAVALYEDLLSMNVAPEMARMVLPQSMVVDFIWSGNLLAFSHVYNLRAGEGAQEEAKQFAEMLDAAISAEFPIGWKALKE